MPGFLPDAPEIRSDILDYLLEIQRFDREVGEALALLERAGKLDNTIVVITSDNGMAFPGAKTHLYDHGVRVPLAVQWPTKVQGVSGIEYPRAGLSCCESSLSFCPTTPSSTEIFKS